jgi:ribulose-bisphosphate carboxylase large chain
MGIQAKATEYRILLETVIQARDEGNDLLAEGPEILERAVKVALPALAGARDFEAGEALTPYVAAISKR